MSSPDDLATDDRVVIAVAAQRLTTSAQRDAAAAVAGVPRAVVDAMASAGLGVALTGLLPPDSARLRLPSVQTHLPEAQVGAPGGVPAFLPAVLVGSAATLLVVAGAVATYVDPLAGAVVAVAAVGDLVAAGWLARRARDAGRDAALVAAQRRAVDALTGDAAPWMAIGGLRRATLDLPESVRADVHGALEVVEARLGRGEGLRAVIAEVQEAVDALRAVGVLGQRGSPDAAELARRAVAVRAAAERPA